MNCRSVGGFCLLIVRGALSANGGEVVHFRWRASAAGVMCEGASWNDGLVGWGAVVV